MGTNQDGTAHRRKPIPYSQTRRTAFARSADGPLATLRPKLLIGPLARAYTLKTVRRPLARLSQQKLSVRGKNVIPRASGICVAMEIIKYSPSPSKPEFPWGWGQEGQHGRSEPRRRRATFVGSDLTFSAIVNDRTRAGIRRTAASSLSTRTLSDRFLRSGVFDVPLRRMELQKLIWEPHDQAAHLRAGYR